MLAELQRAPALAPEPPQIEPGDEGAQLAPSGVLTEALAAGAITVCSTGTDQATPPTTPAFFRKSRREEGEVGRAGTTESGEVGGVPCAARLAQRSSQLLMVYPR
jgi:hypothetical protein